MYQVSKCLISELVDSKAYHPKNIRHESKVTKCDKGYNKGEHRCLAVEK